ncbi:FliI/YscN family ATPase [Limnobacter humi]|uniref:FliI/YscN family ATPase n=1 Tax=Limnobacter humi TaxID=1778671 RepID=A0ABT1WF77_9BURK|nr:FliI/YscN family ATPase [Limnobacter humi]MCQ8895553.1 FliI/YscN family ATPase [Limnobacter humi]
MEFQVLQTRWKKTLDRLQQPRRSGLVDRVLINQVECRLPAAEIGEMVEIQSEGDQNHRVLGEVFAFEGEQVHVSCLEPLQGINRGARVYPLGTNHRVLASEKLFGSVLDGLGRPLDYLDPKAPSALDFSIEAKPVISRAPLATQRPPIEHIFSTGVRVIDGLNTLGIGQRVGVFAPPGCGKSTLIAQIARGCEADVIVFGLVGERGRELREFMDREIDQSIRSRSLFVCATSDRSPYERVRAAFTATALAEQFRDEGKNVLLLIDSITRLARAQREIGLMAGEPSTQAGFTPSVYTILPELIERAGRTPSGNITAIYTVLMEGSKIDTDPVASESKSLLDGHLILNPKLVNRNQFPAVDPLSSLSRVMNHITDQDHQTASACVRSIYDEYEQVELLLRLNEYKTGSDPKTDLAIDLKPKLDHFFKQSRSNLEAFSAMKSKLINLVAPFEHYL